MEHAPFPPDLIELQADWQLTYAALTASRPVHTSALRRRLQPLSGRLQFHPYWSGPGRTPAARVELRRQARALGERP
ncbi:hypothetical protein OG824_35150 [Streptomyces prunicolor]|uniref:Uncharacterized protein n=1 Tax=Streptomyces prunicolor TaxID=67348 RepID=A0ABU4F5N8_9ACTN|nr:hypothetical protein [Streptomyces prunicolor]MDV7215896.1 hypothetical protein [Streptomyces prunicolor]